jgi:hypothetical protein
MNIPQNLWESFQAQLVQEGRNLCKDTASILGVPEKELLRTVFAKIPKLKIIPDTREGFVSCLIPIKRDTILERCRHPCVLGTDRCIQHQHIESFEDPQEWQEKHNKEQDGKSNQESNQEIKPLRLIRLEANSIDPSYWCNRETGFVYISSGKIIGKYVDGIIIKYEI